MKLVLEARHLFDGSLHAVAKHATDAVDHDHALHPADVHAAAPSHADPASDGHAAVSYADVPALAPNPTASEILFVDPRVANWQSLASSVKSDVQVVLIDPAKDGIDQVTQALQGRTGLTSIQFLTYGQPGQLELGDSAVTTASLSSHAAEVASWGDHLAAGGDIEFWGCNVGQGSAGQAFVETVHTLTGAAVGASTDDTGAASLGGNWILEDTTGSLHGAVFSDAAMAAYHDILDDTPAPVVTLGPTTGTLTPNTNNDVLLGDTFTETLTFKNGADPTAGMAGFGPIVELFVPTNTATDTETATLDSATYLGAPVTTHTIALTSTDATHPGIVGAYDPYVLDNTGKATWVAAPTGFKAGDSMIVLVLPFGSFTVGEPTADIQLNFTADATSVLSAHTGTIDGGTLAIAARGAFEFGEDALNDPTTDPSLVGSFVTPASPTTYSLLNITATTDLHEGETATGPDNPFNYVLTVVSAPAANGDITGTSVTFALPGQVDYTGGTIAITDHNGATIGADSGSITTGVANAPGGDITVLLPTLSSGDTTIKVPVFVPRVDASGDVILRAASGFQTVIDDTPAYHYTANWTPTTGLAVVDGQETLTGGGSADVQFVAKALAIQVTDNIGNAITPGQAAPVTETIAFQVSDYIDLSNLVITDIVGDGLTLVPGTSPTLTIQYANGTHASVSANFGAISETPTVINGQSVAVNGSNSDADSNVLWNYNRDDTSGNGTTTINFMVGALLADSLVSAIVGGSGAGTTSAPKPTQGTIQFTTHVLDKYTETNPQTPADPVTGSGGGNPGLDLREGDFVTNQVVSSGTSETTAQAVDNVDGTNAGNTSDTSGLTDTVAPNTLALTIVDVNGTAPVLVNGNDDIKAGDDVTYQLTYTLTKSQDYGDLQLTSFLPEPIYSAVDPTGNGSTQFSAGDGLTAGTYKLVAGTNPVTAAAIQGVATSATDNSVTFSLGSNTDTQNLAGHTITIDFTVKASNTPFANGLFLTDLANSQNFDAHAVSTAINANAIQPVVLNEPELVTKTGIVSLVGDTGTVDKGTYSADPNDRSDDFTWAAQGTAPTGAFEAATTGSLLVPSGTNPLQSSDLNVTGADANDTARVVTTVENTGGAAAYNVEVKGATLPSGATIAGITVYNSAGVAVSTADIQDLSTGQTLNNESAATAAANYLSTGIKISESGGLAANGVYYVVYDMKLPATQTTGATLDVGGSIVDWWNNSASTSSSTGFVSNGAAIGVNADALTDGATIGVTAPTLDKQLTGISGTTTLLSDDITIGGVATYTLTLTLPEGVTTDGSRGDDIVTDSILPAGTTFTKIDSITFNGVTSTGGTPTQTTAHMLAANTVNLSIDLGQTLTNNSNGDTPGTIVIVYEATVTAGKNHAPTDNPGASVGTVYQNSAGFHYDGGAGDVGVAANVVTVTEVDPSVSETISASPTGNVYSGENLTYTITLTNNGNATAENLSDEIDLPTGLTYSTTGGVLAVGTGTAVNAAVDATQSGSGILKVSADSLAAGASETFTFHATVNNDQAAGTNLTVQTTAGKGSYFSLPGTGQGQEFENTASTTQSIATFTPNLGIIGEENNTSGGGTVLYTTAVDGVDATIGDIVRYSAYVQVPEGENANQTLVVNLPAGMTFDNSTGSVTVLLVSPGGDLTSSNVSGGTTSYTGTYDPTKAIATTTLDNSLYVSGTGTSTITFNLGTLQDNESSAKADYVIVQFNAIVANASTVGTGSGQTATQAATVTAGGNTSTDATVTVEEPDLTLTKGVSSIVTSGGVTTVSYTETVKNTGDATAYNVALDDPDAGSNVSTIANATIASGSGLTISSGNGTHDLQVTGSLTAGASETFTYTETVTTPSLGVADTTAKVTYTSLSSASETLAGTTTGATGTATGTRDGVTAPLSTNDYEAQVTLGLGVVEGNVWNDVGSPLNAADKAFVSGADTELSGITISGTWTGGTSSVVTDGSGNFAILLPDAPGIGQTVAAVTASGSGASLETLVYDTTNSTTFHHTETGLSSGNAKLTVTPSGGGTLTGYNFAYRLPDTAPVLSTWGNTSPTGTVVTDVIGGAAVVLGTGGAGVADSEIDSLATASAGNYDGTVLTVNRNGGANADDVFGGAGTASVGLFFTGSAVDYNGTQIGTFTQSAGTLAITFNSVAGATKADIQNVLNALTYSNTGSADQLTSGILINATLSDHNTQTGSTAGNAYQGTGGVKTSAAVQVLIDLAPTPATAAFTDPNDTSALLSAVTLAPNVVLTDAANLSQVVLTVTTNHQAGEDVLTFTPNVGSFGDIQGTFDGTAGTMTLTSAGSATVAQWQAALRSVQYYDSSDTPHTGTRTVTFTTTGTDSGTISGTLATVTVTAANDSPVLHDNPVSLTPGTENVLTAPVDGTTVGTQISALIGGGNVTDTDGANSTHGQTPGALGIAVTAADTTEGNWWFTTDGGAHWTEFAGTGTTETALNGANALHLASNVVGGVDQTQIYFQPTVTNANGVISNALTFRGWDQFDTTLNPAVINGAVTNLPTDTAFGTGTNSQASAYSSAVQTLPITIAATRGATYVEVNGPDTGTAAVVVDGPAVLTATTDIFTSATISITNFQPEDHLVFVNGNGVTGQYDSSTGVMTLTATAGVTAATMQAAIDAVTYYDSSNTPVTTTRNVTISAHDNTAGSDVAVATTTIAVTAANDSPVLTVVPSDSFTTGTENGGTAPVNGTTVGTLVSSLIAGHVTDADNADLANTSATPPTGALGIAITQADTTAGTWWYSTDAGAHWTEFAGTGTTETALNGGTNALHLLADADTMIYFAPAAGANGAVDTALTYRAWDQYFNAGTGSASANGSVSTLPTDSSFGTGSNTNASAYSANQQVLSLAIAGSQTVTYTDPNGPNPASSALAVDSGFLLTTGDAITSATVTLSGGNAEDILSFTNDSSTMGNITGSYAGGVLTLSSAGHTATAAQFQAAIDAVKFYDASDTPITGNRTATIAVADGTTASTRTFSSTTLTVDAANDSPVLTVVPSDSFTTGTENGGTAPVNGTTVGTLVSSLIAGHVTDADNADLANTSATPPTGALGIAITQADTTAGTWWYSTDAGAHWTEFAGTGTTETALNGGTNALHLLADADTMIYFAPAAGANGAVDTALTYRAWDQYFNAGTGSASANGSVSTLPTDSSFGTGSNTNASAYSANQQVLSLAIAGSQTVTYTDPNGPNPASSALAVDSGFLLTTGDAITSATVTLSGGNAEDILSFTNDSSTMGNITGSYAGGVLTLSSAGHTATAAQFQAAIDAVKFYDASDTPITGNRTATIAVADGTTASTRTFSSTTLTVDAANDSPVLNGTGVLGHGTEDSGAPVGAVGTLVSSLIGGGNVTDTDGADAHDGATPGTLGIAITGADTTEGTWYYTTDNGAHWTAFAGTGTPTISDTNALHLVGDANTRIYFDPVANWNGTLPTALTIRGWDQFDGAANGSLSALPTDGTLGAGTNTHASAYSSATQTLPLTVDAVNDAPIATGSATLASVSQDAQSNPGDTVSDLFGGNFSDTADQQHTAANPTGSVANVLAGVAITGNAAAGQGTWEYSTDGANWIAVPTNVSDNSAILVPVTGSIRFVPNDTFHGTPGGLTVHLIDSSSGALTQASTGVDVTNVGGTTVFSAAPVVLTTSVTEGGGTPILTPPNDPSGSNTITTDPVVDKPSIGDIGVAGGNHGDTTDDFLERPIIPQVSLIGSVGNKFVIAEQQAIIAVPENLFEDSYPGAQLEFDARNPAGGALPSWLEFDARNLTFSGTPPASAHGAVDVLIIAKDQFGNEATASFRILVGRESEDLQHLLEPNAPPPEDVAPVTVRPASNRNQAAPANGAAPGRRTHSEIAPHDRHADLGHAHGGTVEGLFASLAQPAHGAGHGHSAFSAQLREAGPIGRLSHARQLLETIAKTVSSKPAA